MIVSTILAFDFSPKGILPIMAPYLDDLARETRDKHNADPAPLDKPAWTDLSQEKRHRWRASAGHAALAGADLVLAFLERGETDPAKLREHVLRAYGCGDYDAFAGTTGAHPDLPRGRGKAISTTGNC